MRRRAWNTYLGVAAAAVAGYRATAERARDLGRGGHWPGPAPGDLAVGRRSTPPPSRPARGCCRGYSDPLGGRRQLPVLGRPCGQHCLPGGRHPGAGHGHSAVGRRRQPRPGVSPAGWGDAAVPGRGCDLGRDQLRWPGARPGRRQAVADELPCRVWADWRGGLEWSGRVERGAGHIPSTQSGRLAFPPAGQGLPAGANPAWRRASASRPTCSSPPEAG